MSLFLLDTDHLTLYQHGDVRVVNSVARHAADQLAISVVTIDEQLTGWQAASRRTTDEARLEQIYIRMAQTVESLASWTVLHYPIAAMRRHADLKRLKLNVKANDLKIAAIALEFNATVVTHNQKDFSRVPGIRLQDWAV